LWWWRLYSNEKFIRIYKGKKKKKKEENIVQRCNKRRRRRKKKGVRFGSVLESADKRGQAREQSAKSARAEGGVSSSWRNRLLSSVPRMAHGEERPSASIKKRKTPPDTTPKTIKPPPPPSTPVLAHALERNRLTKYYSK
jgi:hypothetical protein